MKIFFAKIKNFLGPPGQILRFSLKSWLSFFGVIGIASVFCAFLRTVTTSDVHVPLIFVMAVLIIALTTDGYFYGLLASLVSVVTVNFAFTYPYQKLDFSIYGYPLTFFTMLMVSIVVSTLVTHIKQQDEMRVEAEKEKVRATLLRAISHDLRTPLTTISGSIATVLDSGDTLSHDESRKLLSDAKSDAEWLHRMVENLLSVTRISKDGGAKIDKQGELLEEVIGEAVMNFKKRFPGVEIVAEVPSDPVVVPMDAMLIEQVLLNLMDNSVSHGVTTTKVKVSATLRQKEAVISVEDDGRGIGTSTLEQLFNKNIQIKPGEEPDSTRGMGIGLTVCKAIVSAHGGSLSAGNIPGSGARITFTLPLGDNYNDYQG